jgi:hypothetical protein
LVTNSQPKTGWRVRLTAISKHRRRQLRAIPGTTNTAAMNELYVHLQLGYGVAGVEDIPFSTPES